MKMPRTPIMAATLILIMVLTGMPSWVGGSDIPSEDVPGPMLYTHYGAFRIEDLEREVPHYGGDTQYWIVQFDGPITVSDLEALDRTGVEVLDYFPDFGFVVHLDGLPHSVLDDIPGTVGSTPFPSGLKMDPEMLPLMLMSKEVVVELFRPDPGTVGLISEGHYIDEIASSTRLIVRSPPDPVSLAMIDGVKWMEPRTEHVLFNDVSAEIMDVVGAWQDLGLDGTGQTIAVSDTGLDTGVDDHNVTGDIHLDFDNRAIITNWAGTSPDDGHGHGTHVAGSVGGSGNRSSGNFKGMAYNSTIFFSAISDNWGNLVTPGNLSKLFQESYDAGARVHTNSWGSGYSAYFGAYTTECYDVDWTMFHYPEMLVLFAAGNDGTDSSPQDGRVDAGSVSPPATAKSSLSVGASENFRVSGGYQTTWGSGWPSNYPMNPIANDRISNNSRGMAAFSSRGPTDDNRIKPEIVAPGTNILSTRSSAAPSYNYWSIYDNYYGYMGGTSMSTPLTAGMAGLVRQYFTDRENVSHPLGALVKAAIVNGGFDMTPGQYGAGNPTTQEVRSRPDNAQGWGRADLMGAVSPSGGRISFLQDPSGMRTGENITRWVKVSSGSDLRVTLAWADYPGDPYVTKQLVNDLDLRLTSPEGTIYCGNDLTDPYTTLDRVNPTETVTVKAPVQGWWKVEVTAYNVPKGPQHFAVVASGNITDLLTNTLKFDRAYYSTDDALVTVELIALDTPGLGSVQIKVNSTSDPVGIDLTMSEFSEGMFRGTFRTSNVSTLDPNRLFVAHNDTILTNYSRSAFGLNYKASAVSVKPVRAYLYPDRDHLLTYSLYDILSVRVLSQAGADLRWTLEGANVPEMVLYDDGAPFHDDAKAFDGNYSGRFMVTRPMHSSYRILLIAYDPYLGRLVYPQLSIAIDTDMPRFPRNLTAVPLDEGNGVMLGWENDNVSDRSRFDIYMNDTGAPPALDPSVWHKISEAQPRRLFAEVRGLADNVPYSFRIASVNQTGASSSLSSWATVVPRDVLPPQVSLVERPWTLSDVTVLRFEADPDTQLVQVEYALDLDRDGSPDGDYFHVGETSNLTLAWDTREASGGPGNVSSIVLRYRALDEVPNPSEWIIMAGFSVDNVPPATLRMIDAIEPLTRQAFHSFTGETEAFASVTVLLNGFTVNEVRASADGRFFFNVRLEEGSNLVQLWARDQNGAGPVGLSFVMVLDTIAPHAVISTDVPGTVDISSSTYMAGSASVDEGGLELNAISNLSWELRGPFGPMMVHYGNSSMVFSFRDLGLHRLRLVLYDLAGNRNETELRITVTDRINPTPTMTGPTTVNEDTFINFVPGPGIDNDPYLGDEYGSFLWRSTDRYGEADEVQRENATFIFQEPGVYNITLIVTDRMENQGFATSSVLVKDITPPEVTVFGAVNLIEGSTGTYTFNATDNDPDFHLTWNATWTVKYLDDADQSTPIEFTGLTLAHTFEAKGNYTIALSVSDASGNVGTASIKVLVHEKAVGDGDGDDRSFPYLLMAVGTLIVLCAAGFVVYLYIKNKPEISEVDWEDDDWDLDEEE